MAALRMALSSARGKIGVTRFANRNANQTPDRRIGHTVMLVGYNTNGFAHHRLCDAISVLCEIGYRSIAITLDSPLLDPPDRHGVGSCVKRIRSALGPADPRVTVETGGRFLLDPRRKHQPALVSRGIEARRVRIEFLKAAVDVSAELSADSVSLWSGSPDDEADPGVLFDRLEASLGAVLDHAERRHVRLSFEPEPGMFIDTMARFAQLRERLDHPLLGLTFDVGHLHCQGDGSVGDHVHRWEDRLWNIHIEDMRRSAHEHLMFGDGDIEFDDVFDALRETQYTGPVHVELPRHSHDAVAAAEQSYAFLRRFFEGGGE